MASSLFVSPDDYRSALTNALVAEIRAEMGRRGVRTIRELAERAEMAETAVKDRLNKNSRTGRRTPIRVPELAAIARALEVDPIELLQRAMAEVDAGRLPDESGAVPDAK